MVLNMKKIMLCFFLLIVMFTLRAADTTQGELKDGFLLYVNVPLTREDAAALSKGVPLNSKGKFVVGNKNGLVQIVSNGGEFKSPVKNPAILETVFTAENDGVVSFGAGGDWWFECFINGESVYSTMKNGNQTEEINSQNHIFPARVKKGENRIAIFLLSGSAGWSFSMKKQQPLEYPLAKFPRRPWLTHADVGSVTVNFLSDVPVMGFVDFREVGTAQWQRAFDLLGGQARNDQDKHTIRLSGLKPDAVYEYRIGGSSQPHRDIESYGEIFTFRSFTQEPKEFSLFYTSDTQFSDDKRVALLTKFRRDCGARNADLFVHGGDLHGAFDVSARFFQDSFIDILTQEQSLSQPLVMVRGNHEYRGDKCADFFRYFGGRENKSYYMFRQGNVCFIVLDSGEDKPRIPSDRFYTRTYDRELLKEQREWLTKAVKSKAFQSAKFRVVFVHTPGDETYMGNAVEILTDGIFTGKNPAEKIHLWVAAHTHRYSRTVKVGTNEQRAYTASHALQLPTARLHFAYLVNDGPGGGPGNDISGILFRFRIDEIEVQSMTPEGKVFDHFSVLADGMVREINTSLPAFNPSVK